LRSRLTPSGQRTRETGRRRLVVETDCQNIKVMVILQGAKEEGQKEE
jgi:hypothetical protein